MTPMACLHQWCEIIFTSLLQQLLCLLVLQKQLHYVRMTLLGGQGQRAVSQVIGGLVVKTVVH